MTNNTEKKFAVKIYAMASTTYTCTNPQSIHEKDCDIYFPTVEGSDNREDLGADEYHYSVEGKDEMVLVNKELLEALVDQCQRQSEDEAIYNDNQGTSFKYADLNKLVLGMKFPKSIVGEELLTEDEAVIDTDLLNSNISLVV